MNAFTPVFQNLLKTADVSELATALQEAVATVSNADTKVYRSILVSDQLLANRNINVVKQGVSAMEVTIQGLVEDAFQETVTSRDMRMEVAVAVDTFDSHDPLYTQANCDYERSLALEVKLMQGNTVLLWHRNVLLLGASRPATFNIVLTAGAVNANLLDIVNVIKETGELHDDHRAGGSVPYSAIRKFGIAHHSEYGMCLVAVHHFAQSLNRIEVRDGKAYITRSDVGGTFRADHHNHNWDLALLSMMNGRYSKLVAMFDPL